MEKQNIISIIGKIRRYANDQIIRSLMERGLKGISPSHGGILVILFQEEIVPMKVIAQRIDRKKNTVTVLVEKLVKLGFVQKKSSVTDNRVNLVSLTPKGRSLIPDFEEISKELIKKVYTGFADYEKEDLSRLLAKVLLNFQKTPSDIGSRTDLNLNKNSL